MPLQCGTPEFTAPEITTGREYDGPSVDMWSMGVILYEALTGSLPFKGTSTAALFKAIQRYGSEGSAGGPPGSGELAGKGCACVRVTVRACVRYVMDGPEPEGRPGPGGGCRGCMRLSRPWRHQAPRAMTLATAGLLPWPPPESLNRMHLTLVRLP